MQITGWFAWRPHRRWLRPTITGVHQTPDSAAAIKLQVRIRMQLGGLWTREKTTCGIAGRQADLSRMPFMRAAFRQNRQGTRHGETRSKRR